MERNSSTHVTKVNVEAIGSYPACCRRGSLITALSWQTFTGHRELGMCFTEHVFAFFALMSQYVPAVARAGGLRLSHFPLLGRFNLNPLPAGFSDSVSSNTFVLVYIPICLCLREQLDRRISWAVRDVSSCKKRFLRAFSTRVNYRHLLPYPLPTRVSKASKSLYCMLLHLNAQEQGYSNSFLLSSNRSLRSSNC